MPRIARVVLPEVAHHITQRGNNRQDVFFVEDDRALYLQLLNEESRRWGLSLLGYCLMTNHIHLIGILSVSPL
jgi:putative transposase